VTEALRDIRLHELATMAAMQEAVREMLAKIEPGKLRAATESGGIGLAMQRKAKAWEIFETEFARLQESLSERFDDAFGRSFAKAYEQVMAELQTKGPSK
jgi:predicted component of type VI protein secretion system